MLTSILIGIIILGISLFLLNAKRQQRRHQEIVESYVASIFSQQDYCPTVNAGFTYGIPSFQLKFKSDADKQHAVSNGLTEQFTLKIQILYRHLKPRGESFDAEHAVSIYSEDDLIRWSAEASDQRDKRAK